MENKIFMQKKNIRLTEAQRDENHFVVLESLTGAEWSSHAVIWVELRIISCNPHRKVFQNITISCTVSKQLPGDSAGLFG